MFRLTKELRPTFGPLARPIGYLTASMHKDGDGLKPGEVEETDIGLIN